MYPPFTTQRERCRNSSSKCLKATLVFKSLVTSFLPHPSFSPPKIIAWVRPPSRQSLCTFSLRSLPFRWDIFLPPPQRFRLLSRNAPCPSNELPSSFPLEEGFRLTDWPRPPPVGRFYPPYPSLMPPPKTLSEREPNCFFARGQLFMDTPFTSQIPVLQVIDPLARDSFL